MFSHQSCVMEYVRNLYISKSNDNTTTKNTIARQYTERRQLLCQLLLVIIMGENDTQWIAFFFLLRARGYSNSEYKHHFCAELSHCFSIILKQLITSVSVTSGAWCISSTHHLLFRLSSIIPMKFCLLVYFCFLFCLFFFIGYHTS